MRVACQGIEDWVSYLPLIKASALALRQAFF